MKKLLLVSLKLLLPVLLFTGCAMRDRVAPGTIPPPVMPEQNSKLGAESYVESFAQENGYKESKNGKYIAQSKRVVAKILQSANYNANSFPLHVLETGEDANAMVVDGASIVIYSGLLDKIKSDDELAVILGHEVGHVLAKHNKEADEEKSRQSTVETGSSILGTITQVGLSAAGFDSSSASAVGDLTSTTTGLIGYGAYVQSFNRDQEYEADEIGLMLMTKAGYDPQAALSFWKRSKEVFGSESSSVGAFFNTHPASSDRLEALEKTMPLTEQYKGAGKNPTAVKVVDNIKKSESKKKK